MGFWSEFSRGFKAPKVAHALGTLLKVYVWGIGIVGSLLLVSILLRWLVVMLTA